MQRRPANLDYSWPRAASLAVGAGGCSLDIFLSSHILAEVSLYRKKEALEMSVSNSRIRIECQHLNVK